MKKNKEFPYLAFALLCIWAPLFMGAWDKDKPASSTSLRSSNPQILANQSALETALAQDHEFSTGGTNSGEHKQIKLNAPIATPTNAANKMFIYGKDVSSVIEAHILDESGNELQITSAGDLYSSAGLTVTNASTFNGSITLGAGDDLIGSATSDITFNTNKFTVAGATGNTVVAGTCAVTGTLDVTGNIDPTTYETTNGGFLDEDAMGSDAADKVASQQSIKAYIAAQIASEVALSAYTDEDSENNAMLNNHAYKAATDGWVSAVASITLSAQIQLYVGTTNDPAGAGDLIQRFERFGVNTEQKSAAALVAKDEYFEIVATSGTPTIRWKSFGTLSKPVDQD